MFRSSVASDANRLAHAALEEHLVAAAAASPDLVDGSLDRVRPAPAAADGPADTQLAVQHRGLVLAQGILLDRVGPIFELLSQLPGVGVDRRAGQAELKLPLLLEQFSGPVPGLLAVQPEDRRVHGRAPDLDVVPERRPDALQGGQAQRLGASEVGVQDRLVIRWLNGCGLHDRLPPAASLRSRLGRSHHRPTKHIITYKVLPVKRKTTL